VTLRTSHTPSFIDRTVGAFQALRIATLDPVKDLLVSSDPCLRAAAAHYLHLLVTSQGLYPPGVVRSVRDALEACWDKEQNLGVLIVLDECLDGHQPSSASSATVKPMRSKSDGGR
jgi:hypothetical protein